MANKTKMIIMKLASLLVALALMLSTMPFGASAAPWDREEEENWSYAYYLGQEYLGNAGGAAVKPDPVGYGFQGVITDLTFVDDAGKTWTFVWSSEANGEWRITGRNVTEAEAKAWPQVTDGGRYVGYCDGTAYVFTLSADGSAKDWTYARNNHANWFYYIRFIRTYTVNVFYQNETGTVEYNGVTYAAQDPLVREFYFLYPNGNIIDDSEYEDGEYTDPITLMPADYLSQDLIDQGYELKYATDAQGRDVLQTGVTISLLGTNVLNVYCTLIPPKTEHYTVLHTYYTNGEYDGQQSGGTLEVAEGADFGEVVDGIEKLPVYAENTYEYTRYRVDPENKTIILTYVRTWEPKPDPVDLTVTKAWANDTPSLRPDSILVQLYRDGVAYGEPVELSEANGWTKVWTGLDGEYAWSVDEVAVPEGYEKSVSVESGIVTITNTHTNIHIGDAQVSVTKVWADNGYPDRPASVTVQLLCGGEAYGEPVVLSADNNWRHTWTGLNEDLTWTLAEINVPEGYTSNLTQDGFDFIITNTMDYEPPAPPAPVDLTVTKAWVNDTPSLRPDSILVQLYRNGVAEGEPVELSEANGWTKVWTGLDGEYQWTADEVAVPEGYVKTVTVENGVVVITNAHTDIRIGDAHVSVTKIWDDNGYPERPTSVTVQLLCGGEAYSEPVVLNADNNWHHTWTELNEDLTWTVTEIEVPEGYASTVAQDGFYFTVTNTMDYEPPTEPTDPPTEPTDPPTEPTDPPTEPTDPPTEPTDPPTEPTDPPTEPTDPDTPAVVNVPVTGGMLSAWIMVSAVSGIGLAGMLMTRRKED